MTRGSALERGARLHPEAAAQSAFGDPKYSAGFRVEITKRHPSYNEARAAYAKVDTFEEAVEKVCELLWIAMTEQETVRFAQLHPAVAAQLMVRLG